LKITLTSSNNSSTINTNKKVFTTAFQNTTIFNNNDNDNQKPLNEKKELIELNNRLGNYINSVSKDLI
jgi:hypothetical protein